MLRIAATVLLGALTFGVGESKAQPRAGGTAPGELNLLTKIAIINEDGRRTVAEYAAAKGVPVEEIRSRFAATGVVSCENNQASGQLTGHSQIVTTSGHLFGGKKFGAECRHKNSPQTCRFIYELDGQEKSIDVGGMVATGIVGEDKQVQCTKEYGTGNDYAVLKLTRPVIGIKPYRLPKVHQSYLEGTDVVSALGKSADFHRRDPSTDTKILRKSIEDCKIMDVNRWNGLDPDVIQSDCDGSGASSGGSMLRMIDGEPVLLGIVRGNYETASQRSQAIKLGTSYKGPYASGQWSTTYTPVSGSFLEAIKRAIADLPKQER